MIGAAPNTEWLANVVARVTAGSSFGPTCANGNDRAMALDRDPGLLEATFRVLRGGRRANARLSCCFGSCECSVAISFGIISK